MIQKDSRYLYLFIFFLSISTLFQCDLNTKSEVDLEFSALQGLLNGSPQVYYLGEIDMEKTTDCGRATVDNAQTGTGTTGGTQQTSTRNTTNNSNSDRYSIISTFNMKDTYETLNMRFTYDRRQVRGAINPQQGFSLTGGLFGNTVTGRQGTVEWGQMGVNLIANQSNQQMNFLQVEVDLTGTYVPGSGTTTPPSQCFTQDGVNCTSVQTSTQCFTTDNRTCLGDTAASEGSVQVLIRGKIRCVAPGIL